MKEVLDFYWQTRKNSIDLGDEIAATFKVDTHECPAEFFSMSSNKITLAIEILDHYYAIWGKAATYNQSKEQIIQENFERVIHVERSTFIEVFSALEYSLKNAILNYDLNFAPSDIIEFKKLIHVNKLYLSTIIEKSSAYGFISKHEQLQWQGLNKFRNIIVHNNAIADVNKSYTYDDFTLNFEKNTMTKGNLMLFCLLTKWIIEKYKNLLLACLKNPQ